jgi:HAD superfamily hydrolase (TIGR01484 family)
MKRTGKTIIYTDLDGTLLDEKSYSFLDAAPALRAAQAKGIPVIFCSSKTSAEIARIRQQLEVRDPFIVENGAAIFTPTGYFPFAADDCVLRAMVLS